MKYTRKCPTCQRITFYSRKDGLERAMRRNACRKCGQHRRNGSVVERYWKYVEKTNECWKWHRGKTTLGYGVVGKQYIHRVSWEIHNGPIPEGMFVLHKCDNPECSNPDHLFVGTQADNMKDADNKNRMVYPQTYRGEDNPTHKLTEVQVREIKHTNGNHSDIAKQYGVSRPTISSIKNNRNWGWL